MIRLTRKAFLFGPFMGDLNYELYNFVPFVIYSKINSGNRIIVYTRPERFDLYGSYADLLVPLRLNEDKFEQQAFRLEGFPVVAYRQLIREFRDKYRKIYKIEAHCYPKIDDLRYKLRWQFPRDRVSYDFKPRPRNYDVMNTFVKNSHPNLFVDLSTCHNPQVKEEMLSKLRSLALEKKNINILVYNTEKELFSFSKLEEGHEYYLCIDPSELEVSMLGCIIGLLQRSFAIIGDIRSPVSHLAVLLKVPLIGLTPIEDEELRLLNPCDTPVYSNFSLRLEDIISLRDQRRIGT